MGKVFLVNPAWSRLGYSVITPRWLFVMAQATPRDLVGDPVLIDQVIEKFDPQRLRSGDIVGIGISTGNCRGVRDSESSKIEGCHGNHGRHPLYYFSR